MLFLKWNVDAEQISTCQTNRFNLRSDIIYIYIYIFFLMVFVFLLDLICVIWRNQKLQREPVLLRGGLNLNVTLVEF